MPIQAFEAESHAVIYSKFRPILPKQVLDYVLGYLSECLNSDDWDLGLDVGCGSGQATHQLSQYFKSVIGLDISEAQIKEAKLSKHPNNITYVISTAENLVSVKSNSVQLLIACEAVHWFDTELFFTEVNRVLTYNGIIALIGYDLFEPFDPIQPNDKTLTNFILNLRSEHVLKQYTYPNAQHVIKRYTTFKFPDNFEYEYRDNIIETIDMTGQDIVGFIKSWSPYTEMLKTNQSEAQEFFNSFEQKLKSLLRTNRLSEKNLMCNYRYFVALGRKK